MLAVGLRPPGRDGPYTFIAIGLCAPGSPHVGARDLVDQHLADAREGESHQARQPLVGVTPASPASPILFQHPNGGFGEGGDALGAAFLGQGVSALTGELAVDERLLSDLGKGTKATLPSPS